MNLTAIIMTAIICASVVFICALNNSKGGKA